MADVRALLRNERLTRRIAHPNAIYSSSGTLSCNVCNLRLQADSLWEPHLAGKIHQKNLQRQQSAPSASLSAAKPPPSTSTTTIPQATNGTGRKRKADDEDVEDIHLNGKKRKAADYESENEIKQDFTSLAGEVSMPRNSLPNGPSGTKTNTDVPSRQDQMDEEKNGSTESAKEMTLSGTVIPAASAVDEDEYAAFEAAIADVTADNELTQQPAVSVLMTGADIAAAPVTAAELASRQADELNQQRKGRAVEIEGEKEDAARALEEEFDEMDQLEARVRKLREKRERLRTTLLDKGVGEEQAEEATTQPLIAESDDDDEEYGYDDDWGF